MKNYCVYCHTNKINGKKYVGMTRMKPTSRWANGKGYRNQPVFFEAINTVGWHNFTHEVLYTDLSKDEAEKLEVELIKEFNSASEEHGYNVDFGGMSGAKFGEEHRRNLSKSCMGRKMCADAVERLRDRMTGSTNPMYGRKRRNEPMKTRKPVMCIESGKVFPSVAEASRSTGVNQGDISRACNGKLKTAGKFHWSFAMEGR
ncbi:MAG: GIY-YIG nuclease family protein [Lachnospiraceae bacterium]|nr:GIY-YIG nuclease family protein [Lachnospiraceae bacterium]